MKDCITPRNFVASFSTLNANAAYTVIPYCQGLALDLPFHLNRLISSYSSLSTIELSRIQRVAVTENILKAMVGLPLCDLVTICLGHGPSGALSSIEVKCLSSSLKCNPFEFTCSDQVTVPFLHVNTCYFDRQNPPVKDCRWPLIRQSLELSRPPEASETLICSYDPVVSSAVLKEGLVSNVFAVDSKRRRVITAPDSDCLPGSMARLILAVCKKLNIQIERKSPSFSNLGKSWDSAFLSSATKPIHGIQSIVAPDLNAYNLMSLGATEFITEIRTALLQGLRDPDSGFFGSLIPYPMWWPQLTLATNITEETIKLLDCMESLNLHNF